MVTDNDQELISALAKVNAASATFSTDLFTGELDQEAHIVMALLLLDVADQVLRHMVAGDGT